MSLSVQRHYYVPLRRDLFIELLEKVNVPPEFIDVLVDNNGIYTAYPATPVVSRHQDTFRNAQLTLRCRKRLIPHRNVHQAPKLWYNTVYLTMHMTLRLQPLLCSLSDVMLNCTKTAFGKCIEIHLQPEHTETHSRSLRLWLLRCLY